MGILEFFAWTWASTRQYQNGTETFESNAEIEFKVTS